MLSFCDYWLSYQNFLFFKKNLTFQILATLEQDKEAEKQVLLTDFRRDFHLWQ